MLNKNIIIVKIINNDLRKRYLNSDMSENKHLKNVGFSRIDNSPMVVFNKLAIRKIKISELYPEISSTKIGNIENEIIRAIINKDEGKIEFIIIS